MAYAKKANKKVAAPAAVETPVAAPAAVETPVAAPAAVETPVAAEAPKKTKKVKGLELTISGEYIHSNRGMQEYKKVFKLPRRDGYKSYVNEAVLVLLKKEDSNVLQVVTNYFDGEKEVDVDVDFFGLTPFDLGREQMFAVKAYYGLRGIKVTEDKRAAQIAIYRQLATVLGREVPQEDTGILQWPRLELCPLVYPNGDTITRQIKPIRFIDDGDRWIKKVVTE